MSIENQIPKQNSFEQERSFVDNMNYTLDQIDQWNSRLREGGFRDIVSEGPEMIYLREAFADFISNPSEKTIDNVFEKLNSFGLAIVPIGNGALTRENAESMRGLRSELSELSDKVLIFEGMINQTTVKHKFAPDVFASHINQFCDWLSQKSNLIDQYLS